MEEDKRNFTVQFVIIDYSVSVWERKTSENSSGDSIAIKLPIIQFRDYINKVSNIKIIEEL